MPDIETLQRALSVISKIAMNENPDENSKTWMDVYMLAHSFSPACPHSEWQALLPKLEDQFKNH